MQHNSCSLSGRSQLPMILMLTASGINSICTIQQRLDYAENVLSEMPEPAQGEDAELGANGCLAHPADHTSVCDTGG